MMPIDKMAELIERLEEKAAFLNADCDCGTCQQCVDGLLLCAAAKALGSHAELPEALEPFARACNIANTDDEQDISDSLAATKITWGDLRRARAVYARVSASIVGGGDGRAA